MIQTDLAAFGADAVTRWLCGFSVFILDVQMCINSDWQCYTDTNTHVHRLRHALSPNSPPLTEGCVAHLWLLTPGASHLLSATVPLSVQSSVSSSRCRSYPAGHHLGYKGLFGLRKEAVYFFPPLRRGFRSQGLESRQEERRGWFPKEPERPSTW